MYINVFLILALFLIQSPCLAHGEPIAIVVHPDSPINSLTLAQLERIYKGKQVTWPNGESIVATNRPPSSPIRKQFYQAALKAKVTQQFLRPGSPIPFKTKRLKSEKAMKRFVGRVPTAIGYLAVNDVDSKVKVLRIDGRLPTDLGYKLQ